jgi:hypothetical protein
MRMEITFEWKSGWDSDDDGIAGWLQSSAKVLPPSKSGSHGMLREGKPNERVSDSPGVKQP